MKKRHVITMISSGEGSGRYDLVLSQTTGAVWTPVVRCDADFFWHGAYPVGKIEVLNRQLFSSSKMALEFLDTCRSLKPPSNSYADDYRSCIRELLCRPLGVDMVYQRLRSVLGGRQRSRYELIDSKYTGVSLNVPVTELIKAARSNMPRQVDSAVSRSIEAMVMGGEILVDSNSGTALNLIVIG